MAVTTSLSCVDYLSIKFGCQNLNSDKEIYNHLSQEWFCRPLIKDFSFNAKNDLWTNIFKDTSQAEKVENKKVKPAVYHKRHKSGKVPLKNNKNRGFGGNVDTARDKKDASHFLSFNEQFVIDEVDAKACSTPKPCDTNAAIDDMKKERDLVSSRDDDCFSESELELMQIYGREISEEISEPVPLKFSRKRTSTEFLARAENENFAKRMRPSINIAKMHQSRILSCDLFGDRDELFVPIGMEPEHL